MERELTKEYPLDTSQKGQLKKWFTRIDDYPRIAGFLKNKFPQEYRKIMQDIFDPPARSKQLIPPDYMRILANFNLNRIITTNFDKLLEDALPSWNSITWQDHEEFPRYLKDGRPLIYHIHGRADRSITLVHTKDEYEKLAGLEGREARAFLQRIFENYTILAVGYRLGDPVVDWVEKTLRSDWGISLNWYALSAEPSEDDRKREWEMRQLHLVSYTLKAPYPDLNKGHEQGITQWFKDLANHLGIDSVSSKEIFTDASLPPEGWQEINETLLQKEPPVTVDVRKRYYHGEPATWSLVKSGFTARRKVTDDVLSYLNEEGLRAILIKGAGGEGKTTILMQIALELCMDYKTYFAFEPDIDTFTVLKNKAPIALIIDHADQLGNLKSILRFASNRHYPTKIVLAARANEWEHAYGDPEVLGDTKRLLTTVTVGKLSEQEAREIARNLLDSGAMVEAVDEETFVKRLLTDSNGFLLAAMLTATHGKSLIAILESVVKHVSGWPDGDELLTALGGNIAVRVKESCLP